MGAYSNSPIRKIGVFSGLTLSLAVIACQMPLGLDQTHPSQAETQNSHLSQTQGNLADSTRPSENLPQGCLWEYDAKGTRLMACDEPTPPPPPQ